MPPSDPVVEGGPVVKLKAHTPHNLTCRASGAKPAAEITWYRDGEIMHEAIYSKVRQWPLLYPYLPFTLGLFHSFHPNFETLASSQIQSPHILSFLLLCFYFLSLSPLL